ncbi:AraC family transcriptional regulator [Paenibacillus ginsengarvi]|uniref:AraC family transcriptional regulator n=1 Tax=Paenibacillus ginsengarvi TaxID=400777 RepID=UPI001F031CEE|nr:AraC family transcriptional regulator [Paenibacillus ginsengarvi]
MDLSLINHRPETNNVVERHFRRFPVFSRKESLKAHPYKLHVQPGIEINLSLAGSAIYVIGERLYTTTPGQLLIFPGHIPHQVFVDKNGCYRRAVVCIDYPTIHREQDSYPFPLSSLDWFDNVSCYQFQLQAKPFTTIKKAAAQMHSELLEQKKGWQRMIIAELLSLTVTVERVVDEQLAAEHRLSQRHTSRDLTAQCCSFIESRLYDDLSLTSVAERFYVSPEHLTRTFKRDTGVAFYQYVLQERIQESKRIMRTNRDLSLTEIAYSLGFASSSHFSRTFKSITGLTPREYRLQSHSEP